MPSIDAAARSAILTWLDGLAASVGGEVLTWRTLPGDPDGTLEDRPRGSLLMPVQQWTSVRRQPTLYKDPDTGVEYGAEDPGGDGRAVYKLGELTHDPAALVINVASADAADDARELVRNGVVLAALASNDRGLMKLELTGSYGAKPVPFPIELTFTGQSQLASASDADARRAWQLSMGVIVDYPWLAEEVAPGIGVMNLSLDVNSLGAFDYDDLDP